MPSPSKFAESAVISNSYKSISGCRVSIGKRLGAGAQGEVFEATIFIPIPNGRGFKSYPCVAKRLNQPETTAGEFEFHEYITQDIPSSQDAAVLLAIGLYVDSHGSQY